MSYKNIDKIIPPDSGVNTKLFEPDEEDLPEPEPEEQEPQQPQPHVQLPCALPSQMADFQMGDMQRRMAKIEKSKAEEEEAKEEIVLMGKLRRWRESYQEFEKDGVVFSKKLKNKIDKASVDGSNLAVLHSIEQELISCVGGDITSPPKQADIILNNLNPVVENLLINFGYDVTGFSEVAKVSCRKSLVRTLIDANLTGDKKIPPSIQFLLIYMSSLSMVYSHNKLRKEQIQTAPEAPPDLEQEKVSQPSPSPSSQPVLAPLSLLSTLEIEPLVYTEPIVPI